MRAAENYLFDEFRKLLRWKPFTEVLKDARDREESYSDAILILINSIKVGLYKGDAGLNTYFRRIYFFKCVTRTRQNATNKNKPVKPDSRRWEDLAPDVEDKLNELQKQRADRLRDVVLERFRHTNYECYYVLKLHDDLGFSYEEIIDFLQSPILQLEDGQTFELDTLIEIVENKQKELKFSNPRTVENTASRCRKALHELAAFLAGKTQQRPKNLEP